MSMLPGKWIALSLALVSLWAGLVTAVTAAPAAGAASNLVFHVAPTFPKYVTGHLELRDPSGKLSPAFFYGKPAASGQLELDARKPVIRMTWTLDQQAQRLGDQSRRVGGELVKGTNTLPVSLSWTQLADLKTETGPEGGKVFSGQCVGSLSIAGQAIEVRGPAQFRFYDAKVDRNPGVMGEVTFSFAPDKAGLKSISGPIQAKATFTAYREIRAVPAR